MNGAKWLWMLETHQIANTNEYLHSHAIAAGSRMASATYWALRVFSYCAVCACVTCDDAIHWMCSSTWVDVMIVVCPLDSRSVVFYCTFRSMMLHIDRSLVVIIQNNMLILCVYVCIRQMMQFSRAESTEVWQKFSCPQFLNVQCDGTPYNIFYI